MIRYIFFLYVFHFINGYSSDVDDGIFDYTCYGKCVYRPSKPWDSGHWKYILHFSGSTICQQSLRFAADLNLFLGLWY